MGNLHHVVEQRNVEQHHVTTALALDVLCVEQHTSGVNAGPGAIAKFRRRRAVRQGAYLRAAPPVLVSVGDPRDPRPSHHARRGRGRMVVSAMSRASACRARSASSSTPASSTTSATGAESSSEVCCTSTGHSAPVGPPAMLGQERWEQSKEPPSWTACRAGTGTLGADRGASQLDRQQSWDRNAGRRRRRAPSRSRAVLHHVSGVHE